MTRVPPSEGRNRVAAAIFNRNRNVVGVGACEPRTECCVEMLLSPDLVADMSGRAKGRSICVHRGTLSLWKNLFPWRVVDLK